MVAPRIPMLASTKAPTLASRFIRLLRQAGEFAKAVLNRRTLRHFVWISIEELADSRIRARLERLLFIGCDERALVEHGHSIGDAERARQLVGDDENGHAKGALQKQNQLI